jgi:hypothetical protein
MIEEFQAFLSSSQAIGIGVLGMVMAMFKAAKVLTNAIDLHESYFVRKRQKRLKDSRASITIEGPFTHYLDEAIQLEAFRIEFGIRVGRLKALALLKIFELGYWDHIQIKNVARFVVVTPDSPSPSIQISRTARVGAWLGLGSGVVTIIVGAASWISIALVGRTFYAYLAGLGLFCAFTVAAGIFATGYGRYKNALGVQDYLRTHPETFAQPLPQEAGVPPLTRVDGGVSSLHQAQASEQVAESV